MKRKQWIMIAGVALAGYLLYRYIGGKNQSGNTPAVATDPTAASNYAQLAGQEQSDMAQLQQQEQSDRAGLLDQIQSLVGTSTPYQQLQAQLAGEHLNYQAFQAQLAVEQATNKKQANRLANQDKRLKRQRQLIRGKAPRKHPHGHSPNPHIAPSHHGPKPKKTGRHVR